MEAQHGKIVKSCKFLERGLTFMPHGIHSCVVNTFKSPMLLTSEEVNQGKLSLERIIEERWKLFKAINSGDKKLAGECLGCKEIYECQYDDVDMSKLGGVIMCIQHYSMCNLRCRYCYFTVSNDFVPPQYSFSRITNLIEEFKERKAIVGGTWINFSGGEPALLKDFEEGLIKLQESGLGHVCVFSNSVKYSPAISKYLAENSITLTTSFDAGTVSTYKNLRGADVLQTVVDNVILYKKTGTSRLFLKYIITESNCNDDDLFAFVFLMVAIKPDCVYIIPEFPYGDREIPDKFITFGARLWYNLKKYGNLNIHIQTDDNHADPKFKKYSAQIREEFNRLVGDNPIDDTYNLNVHVPKDDEQCSSAPAEVEEPGSVENSKNDEDLSLKLLLNRKKSYSYSLFSQFKACFSSCFNKEERVIRAIKNSGLFDELWYLQNNSDLCVADIDPVEHYVRFGVAEGRNPTSWFSNSDYLASNPDVARSSINPFFHYISSGIKEGRYMTLNKV